jgi:hypothetical protein
VCNGLDDNCDGRIDEGVTNRCGGCGPEPAEVCNGLDDNCDGRVDEGVRNACGQCGPVPAEVCNGRDDDCDGHVDEGVLNACGQCGAVPVEVCNGRDDNCDGRTDEGVTNRCGGCGPEPAEACNGRDDDCDGRTDEGVTNRCGGCGPEPAEICNGGDDDCDGRTDEGVLNACGRCGPVPAEACNGQDDDCDGLADEGTLNRCGGCGPEPQEVCNGQDDDCDGTADEDAGCVQSECDAPFGPSDTGLTVAGCPVDFEVFLPRVCVYRCDDAGGDVWLPFYVGNTGTADSPGDLDVALYGEQADGTAVLLQTQTIADPIPSGSWTGTLYFRVEGFGYYTLFNSFRRLLVRADDTGLGGGLIAECDENDNLAGISVNFDPPPCPLSCEDQSPGYQTLPADQCSIERELGPVELDTKWRKSTFFPRSPAGSQAVYDRVMMTPIIANLTDDNRDGRIDDGDIPDIVFNSYTVPGTDAERASGYTFHGMLRVISGDGGYAARQQVRHGDPRGIAALSALATCNNPGQACVPADAAGGHCYRAGNASYCVPDEVQADGSAYTGAALADIAATNDAYRNGANNPSRTSGVGGVAVADFDGDGYPEIVTVSEHANLVVYKLVRETDDLTRPARYDLRFWRRCITSYPATLGNTLVQPAVADLDNDGDPEAVFRSDVCDFEPSGCAVGSPDAAACRETPIFKAALEHDRMVMLVDIEREGNGAQQDRLEMVSSAGISRTVDLGAGRGRGSTIFDTGLGNAQYPDAHAGAANVDPDNSGAELVVTALGQSRNVRLYRRGANGAWAQAWAVDQPVRRNYADDRGGGPPAIADMDPDAPGKEIAVAGATALAVFDKDGHVLWSDTTIEDLSSKRTGVSVYDLNGDGLAEVLYASENYTTVYKGTGPDADGPYLFRTPATGLGRHTSATLYEYPSVADVDRDGQVEIVVASNPYGAPVNGITVYRSRRYPWVSGRATWNQYNYNIVNVDDSQGYARVPVVVPPFTDPAHPNTVRGVAGARQVSDDAADLLPVLAGPECRDECPGIGKIRFHLANIGRVDVGTGTGWGLYGIRADGSEDLLDYGYLAEPIPSGFASRMLEARLQMAAAGQYARIVVRADDDRAVPECDEANDVVVDPLPCP